MTKQLPWLKKEVAKWLAEGLVDDAKYALANFRISLVLRNSRTSRSSSLMRCCSVVVGPGRAPLSRSPWRTHLRSVSPVQPILLAIDSIAAHYDGCWSLASKTMRTARSCTSGENFGDFLIMAPFSIEGASSIPGAVHSGTVFICGRVVRVANGDTLTLLDADRSLRANGHVFGTDGTRERRHLRSDTNAVRSLDPRIRGHRGEKNK